ncbi:hypothetical protein [Streptomyces lydicamycinicus]|uniref:hypothetical protein n=1 Tax=Streptomyces lydicamycinicus TaxID=1546107 RepID=UPI0032DF2DD3
MTDSTAEAAGGTGRAEGADGAAGDGERPRSLYLGVFGLLLGMFLAMVDGMIVGTALPTIVGSSGAWNSCRGW